VEIAVIGWGSLIWCSGSLRIKTKWRTDGPVLPIEFARVSEDDRLTLVIHPGSAPQPTYWALSELDELKAARRNLKKREGCSLTAIHYFPLDNDSPSIPPEVEAELVAWLPKHKGAESVIWTALETNWEDKFDKRAFSVDEAVRYLDKLDEERKQAKATFDRAKEYVQNAPPSIQTEVRRLMREKGWLDAKLSDLLFEPRQD
jgi:hypothetical protein